jgi:hypothetical protein
MQINHEQLKKFIVRSHEISRPLFIHGTTGIGKSQVTKETAKHIAKKADLVFKEWSSLRLEEKILLLNNNEELSKAFIFADTRLSQMDPSDLRGLASLSGTYVDWRPTLLFKTLSQTNAQGIIFFDEMNLACPSVQAAGYQLFLDHCVGELRLSDKVYVLGAGNRLEDRANVFEMAAPLKNRFAHVELLVPTFDAWTNYAIDKGIDGRIIGFLNMCPTMLMEDVGKVSDQASHAFASPRSWEFCSQYITGVRTYSDIKAYASATVGDAVAMQLLKFIELEDKQVNIAEIMDNPELVKQYADKCDLMWVIVSAVAERYRSNQKLLPKVLDLTSHMNADFGVFLLRMAKKHGKTTFMNQVKKHAQYRELVTKYTKYLIDDEE